MLFNTGLTEQEKESLVKYLCTCGELKLLDDGRKVFRFFGDIDVDNQFTAGPLLEKAFNNLDPRK